MYLYFYHTGTPADFSGTPTSDGFYRTGLKNFGSMQEALAYSFNNNPSATNGINPKIIKPVDTKFDDGEYWNGRIRAYCYGDNSAGYNNYDNAIKNKKVCLYFLYAL